jgi:hypothetical protein
MVVFFVSRLFLGGRGKEAFYTAFCVYQRRYFFVHTKSGGGVVGVLFLGVVASGV